MGRDAEGLVEGHLATEPGRFVSPHQLGVCVRVTLHGSAGEVGVIMWTALR
jgi:hypothetical protein